MKARYQDYCSRIENQKDADFSSLNLDTIQQNLLSSNKKELGLNGGELSQKNDNLSSSIRELSHVSPSSNKELSREKSANSLILGQFH